MTRAPINVVGSRIVYQNKHAVVNVVTLESDGRQWEQVYLARHLPDLDVGVIPYENDGVYMLYQYRRANDRCFWQFPGGAGEVGESLSDTASRELSEETGLVAGKLEAIGQTCNEPGLLKLRTTIFVATDLVKGRRNIEHTEVGMKLKYFTIDQVEEMIKKGEVQCGFALASWTFFRNYLQAHKPQ